MLQHLPSITKRASSIAIMSQFRAAKLDIGCFAKIRNIRDHTKRKVYAENEPERYASPPFTPTTAVSCANCECAYRQALRYIIRNTTLPQRVRAQAQLQLSQMHCYTRFTQIKNRCIMGGKGRGVFSDFRLGRVCRCELELVSEADSVVVPISNKRARWEPTWSEQGKLVKGQDRRRSCETCVYYKANTWHWAAYVRLYMREYKPLSMLNDEDIVMRCTFSFRLLSPLAAGTNGKQTNAQINPVLAATANKPDFLPQARQFLDTTSRTR